MKGKSKSSHDLLKDDPRLSTVPAVNKYVTDAFPRLSPLFVLQSDLVLCPCIFFFFFLRKKKKKTAGGADEVHQNLWSGMFNFAFFYPWS